MLETQDDNYKLLGMFKEKYKYFGVTLFLSGILISIPLSLFSLNTFLSVFSSEQIIGNSIFSMLASMIVFFYVIYLSITLIFVSISFIQIYHSNKPRYIERDQESIISITINHYIPIILIFILVGLINIVFILVDNIFFSLLRSFLLIIE